MDDQKELKWWEIIDSGGNRLRQPPEWDRLDEEMAQKAAAPDVKRTSRMT